MKKLIVLLLITSFVFSCKKEDALPPNTYEITVTAKGLYNGIRAQIKAATNNRAQTVIDTAMVINESFTFRGQVENPVMRTLNINSVKGGLPFVLEPGRIRIEIYKDSIQYSKIEGPENNSAFNTYKTELREKTDALNSIRLEMNKARLNNNNKSFQNLSQKSNTINQDINAYPYHFIERHPDVDFSLFLLESTISSGRMNLEKFKESMKSIAAIANKSDYNKEIANRLNIFIQSKENEAKVNIGKVAPNFTGTTPEGNTISLNDIKGKVTIIDFWAAWCAPCRRENPNVVKVYNKYHDKGLEIISVSLDGRTGQNNPKTAWVKAIEKDKLNWHHISSLTYFNEPAARLYSVNSIPATFILDENGVIVSKRLRGAALDKKIGELLKIE